MNNAGSDGQAEGETGRSAATSRFPGAIRSTPTRPRDRRAAVNADRIRRAVEALDGDECAEYRGAESVDAGDHRGSQVSGAR